MGNIERIHNLIQQGNEIKDNLTDENSSKFYMWITESLIFVEKNYPKTEFTKFFISDVESFRTSWITYEIISKETFVRLISSLEGILSHEQKEEKERILKDEETKLAFSKMK